jgi:adenosine deaminase
LFCHSQPRSSSVDERKPVPYWGNHRNPPITREILRALPKADLHCRLDGSVSLQTVWRSFEAAKMSLSDFNYQGPNTLEVLHHCASVNLTHGPLQNFQRIVALAQKSPSSGEDLKNMKKLLNSVLQTPTQLRDAVHDVLNTAVSDGVKCTGDVAATYRF